MAINMNTHTKTQIFIHTPQKVLVENDNVQ